MNFGELQDEVLGDDFPEPKYGEKVLRWINDAQRRILRRIRFDGQIQTINSTPPAGSTSINLSILGNIERIESVVWITDAMGGGSMELDPVEPGDLDEWDAENPDVTGDPIMYAKIGTSLEWRPANATTGTLRTRFSSMPARMTSDGDTPTLHEDYHEMLVTWARAKCYLREDDPQMHDALMADFEAELARLRVDMQGANEDGPIQVEGTF